MCLCSCIHSTIEDDLANNWTCVGMGMNGNDNQYYLWLREGDFLQALLSDDSDHACATNKAPGDSALNANQSSCALVVNRFIHSYKV